MAFTNPVLASIIFGISAAPALAQPDANGYEWATITNPGNPAYTGFDPFGYVTGRGSVGYEYRMARTEVSTGQWMEFFNTFTTRTTPVPNLLVPLRWGAGSDPTYTGPGVRYRLRSLANAAQVGAYGVSWRTAAMYCNWLHNDKSADLSALMSGAYDVSTFGDNPDGTFTDQATRSPGARYWIPSLDEWLKSAHWSPSNPNNGGWSQYSTGTDLAFTYGPPPSFGGSSLNQANSGFTLPGFTEFNIPLGSYPNAPSIWGLLDIAGAGGEWTEEIGGNRRNRIEDGSYAGGVGSDIVYDGTGSTYPTSRTIDSNLRLASSVASPGLSGMLGIALCVLRGGFARSRRTRHEQAVGPLHHPVRGGVGYLGTWTGTR